MGLVKEFREFAIKGNVVDMAIGIVIGAAFGKIVSSLVSDVLTPPLGLLLGGVNFSSLKIVLTEATNGNPGVTINYGIFIQSIVDFLIVAFAMFTVIKFMNRLKRKQEAVEAPAPDKQEILLAEIRDILKAKR